MNWKLMTCVAVVSACSLTYKTVNPVQANEGYKFICQESFDAASNRRLPTTFAWGSRGKIAIIRWETEVFKNWSPKQRCDEVSPRFQTAYENDTINLITNGTMNNQPVICTARGYGQPCHTLLLTLRPEDNSVEVLNHLRAIFNGQRVGPIKHSSEEGQIYYRINIDKFLQEAPVVTD